MKALNPLFIVVFLLFFSSCLKDENLRSYTIYTPIYGTAQQVRDNIKTHPIEPIDNMGSFLIYHDYLLAIDKVKGVHIFDASDKSNPRRIGFIPIPGCLGIAVRNNYLYVNSYMDLFTIDINDVRNVKLTNVKEDVFKSQRYAYGGTMNGDSIIISWIKKDTMVTEEYIRGNRNGGIGFEGMIDLSNTIQTSVGGSSGGNSTGGSMARFVLVNEYMYAVDQGSLYTFNLSTPTTPTQTNSQNVGWNIETIYPFRDKLFIGSNRGMFIYSLTNPSSPVRESEFSHANSCDPVVANDNHAFVTLRSGTACQGFTNQMEVLDVSNITNPKLLKTYPFKNPHGLSLSDNIIFLCDGDAGLRVLDASNPMAIKQKKRFKNIGKAIDVLTVDNTAYVITMDKVLIYKFSSASDVNQIGSINKH